MSNKGEQYARHEMRIETSSTGRRYVPIRELIEGELGDSLAPQPAADARNSPHIRTATARICQPCIDLEGEECHTPECVFCFRSVTEAKWLMDKMLIAPIINGERFVLVDDDLGTTTPADDGDTK